MIFAKLAEAKCFCEEKADCFGVAKHSDEVYTPRCTNATKTSTEMEWMNRNNCIEGNVKPLT